MINKKNIVTIAILSVAISGTILPALKYPTVDKALAALVAADKTVFNKNTNFFVKKPMFLDWTTMVLGLSEFIAENSKLKVTGTKDSVIMKALTDLKAANNDFINLMQQLWEQCFSKNNPHATDAELGKAALSYSKFTTIIHKIEAAITDNSKLKTLKAGVTTQQSKKDAITILQEWTHYLQNNVAQAAQNLKNVTT